MSFDELDAHPRPREDMTDVTTPSSGSQSNDRAAHLSSSLLIRVVDAFVLIIRMSPIERALRVE